MYCVRIHLHLSARYFYTRLLCFRNGYIHIFHRDEETFLAIFSHGSNTEHIYLISISNSDFCLQNFLFHVSSDNTIYCRFLLLSILQDISWSQNSKGSTINKNKSTNKRVLPRNTISHIFH